ncbi:hypothetical protein BEWA_028750 [Theileria equi strain WA]|uniref:Uncharacterized protein n=1 Tax=Theileria equi strain WA TaxID=1537102 RepID=L0AWU8_THEEQ|nr:hypothetical protein BEWA_028750 [Theileria equi strain WA]AFZ80025.1 hypothetical protein BEWA_028750 [Theileria equi strain WA]|eukprot:XP_004829691.1 hypothetical protein BEWA_028750 [Theileria equi strain WA]
MIIPGDPRVMSRYVLAWLKNDKSKYVRVISRYRTCGNFFTNIQEFIKRPSDTSYSHVARTPLLLNVLSQETDEYINVVDVVGDEYYSPGVREFTVQSEKMDEVIIGEVRYGRYIINSRVEDLIFRKVTLEGGSYNPRITITSRYNDGMDITTSYIYISGETNKFYLWEDRRKMIALLE